MANSLEDPAAGGRPLSRRARQTRRSVEAYLEAGGRPRWMERLVAIHRGIAEEKRRLEHAHRTLWEECDGDHAAFASRWRAFARRARFSALNQLIREHNDWYPIERELGTNPRTGDYVLIRGRSYRRPEFGPAWVLEHFPASPPESPRQGRPAKGAG